MGSSSQPIFYIDRARAPESQIYESETVALVNFTRTADTETRHIVNQFCRYSNKVKDEGSGGKGNGKWIRILAGAGLVLGGVIGLYFVYKTGQTIEREAVGVIRDWKEAGFPALVKIEKIGDKFSIY